MNKLLDSHSGKVDIKWTFDCKSLLLSDPVISDVDHDGKNEIVVATKDGDVFILDEDAKVKAICKAKEELDQVEMMFLDTETVNSIEASPSVADINNDNKQEIIFGSKLGILYCFDHTGKNLWKFNAKHEIGGKVLITDISNNKQSEILFGCMDKNVYALNNFGKLVWKTNVGAGIKSGLGFAQSAGLIIACDVSGVVHALSSKGDVKWTFETEGKIHAPVTIVNLFNDNREIILVGSTDNHLYALDTNGVLLWKFQTEGAIISQVSVGDINNDGKNEIVCGSCDSAVYAINNEGSLLWSYHTDFWVGAKPIILDLDKDGKKEVIAGSYDHNVYILEGEGTYQLDMIPGISGIVNQAGHYSDLMSQDPGEQAGKRIWQRGAGGIIVGLGYNSYTNSIIVCTKDGKINNLVHIK